MNRMLHAAFAAAVLLAVPALAKTPPPAQTHQCVKGGAVLQKTKKECHAAGGVWQKLPDAPKAGAAKPAEVKPAEVKPVEPAPAPVEPAPAPAR